MESTPLRLCFRFVVVVVVVVVVVCLFFCLFVCCCCFLFLFFFFFVCVCVCVCVCACLTQKGELTDAATALYETSPCSFKKYSEVEGGWQTAKGCNVTEYQVDNRRGRDKERRGRERRQCL